MWKFPQQAQDRKVIFHPLKDSPVQTIDWDVDNVCSKRRDLFCKPEETFVNLSLTFTGPAFPVVSSHTNKNILCTNKNIIDFSNRFNQLLGDHLLPSAIKLNDERALWKPIGDISTKNKENEEVHKFHGDPTPPADVDRCGDLSCETL